MRIEAWVERIPLCPRCQESEPERRVETGLRSPFHCWGCDSEEAQLVMLDRRSFAVLKPTFAVSGRRPGEQGLALSFYLPVLHPFHEPLHGQNWLRLSVKRVPVCESCTGPIAYGTRTAVSRVFHCWMCGKRPSVTHYRLPYPQAVLLRPRDEGILVGFHH